MTSSRASPSGEARVHGDELRARQWRSSLASRQISSAISARARAIAMRVDVGSLSDKIDSTKSRAVSRDTARCARPSWSERLIAMRS